MENYIEMLNENYKNIYNRFFSSKDINESVSNIMNLIRYENIKYQEINSLLDNMINYFEYNENYEICDFLLKIKTELNNRGYTYLDEFKNSPHI